MHYFPFYFDLKNKTVLIVGGGVTALRKYKLLKKANANIELVSLRIDPTLEQLLIENDDRFNIKAFEASDVSHQIAVIAATEDHTVNTAIEQAARAKSIPVNVVDSPSQCDFIFPSILERGPISVAVSSSGMSPVLARLIKSRVATVLPNTLTRVSELLATHRDRIKNHIVDPEVRKVFYENLFHNGFIEEAEELNAEELEIALIKALKSFKKPKGKVALIGAGPGDPELLTIKALRYLQMADVVLYDRLVGEGVLELCRRDAHFVDVGKKKGFHKFSQERINEMLAEYAQEGLMVVRLKGGDPYIFGRGGEEAQYLIEKGISTTVVPGITAAAGAGAIAGIPLTHRDYAHSVIFTTAYKEDMRNPSFWKNLSASKSTLVFYMGSHVLSEIAHHLIHSGMAPNKPLALISAATRRDQKVFVSNLKDAAEGKCPSLPSPTLIVVGEVVKLRKYLKGHAKGQKAHKRTKNFLITQA